MRKARFLPRWDQHTVAQRRVLTNEPTRSRSRRRSISGLLIMQKVREREREVREVCMRKVCVREVCVRERRHSVCERRERERGVRTVRESDVKKERCVKERCVLGS
jgi:hypothetical protein